jgi:hypothetical protein
VRHHDGVLSPRSGAFLVALCLLTTAGCSRGGDDAAPPVVRDTTTSTQPAAVDPRIIRAELAGVEPELVALPDEVAFAVADVVGRYLTAGSLAPLRGGTVGAELGDLVTPAVAERLTGPDREVLVDEGLPHHGSAAVARANIGMRGLMGPDGTVALVVAGIDVELQARPPDAAAVTVHRHGELLLVPVDDGWRIDSYELEVKRDVVPPATTTTVGGDGS